MGSTRKNRTQQIFATYAKRNSESFRPVITSVTVVRNSSGFDRVRGRLSPNLLQAINCLDIFKIRIIWNWIRINPIFMPTKTHTKPKFNSWMTRIARKACFRSRSRLSAEALRVENGKPLPKQRKRAEIHCLKRRFASSNWWSRARRPSSGTSAPSSNRTCRFPAYGFPCGTGFISFAPLRPSAPFHIDSDGCSSIWTSGFRRAAT